jgi:hypothetical protein
MFPDDVAPTPPDTSCIGRKPRSPFAIQRLGSAGEELKQSRLFRDIVPKQARR